MLRFFERPMAVCGSADDTGFTVQSEYLDAIYEAYQASVANGHPATRARCASNIMCVLLGRAPGTTMYPGDSPGQQLWLGADRGSLGIWEDVSLIDGDVVFD
jgi:hypothetical protein